MNIHLECYGTKFPIVFFHGWGFDSQIWLPLIPQLITNYQIILVDLPGFGFTPTMEWNDFKKNLLTRLPNEFAVAGWSLGGLYATRLAIEMPQRVTHLINITSAPRFIADEGWPGISKNIFAHFYTNLSRDVNATLKEFIELQLNKHKVSFVLGNSPSPEGLASGLTTLDTWDLRAELSTFKQPACFMFGRLDPITSVKIMKTMQEEYPDFKYILFNKAAHMPFLSHMDLFIQEFEEFVQ